MAPSKISLLLGLPMSNTTMIRTRKRWNVYRWPKNWDSWSIRTVPSIFQKVRNQKMKFMVLFSFILKARILHKSAKLSNSKSITKRQKKRSLHLKNCLLKYFMYKMSKLASYNPAIRMLWLLKIKNLNFTAIILALELYFVKTIYRIFSPIYNKM